MVKKFKEFCCDLNYEAPINFTGVLIVAGVGKEFYYDGRLHREDGPAIVYATNVAEPELNWYMEGMERTEEYCSLLYMLKYKKELNYKLSDDYKDGQPILYNRATAEDHKILRDYPDLINRDVEI